MQSRAVVVCVGSSSRRGDTGRVVASLGVRDASISACRRPVGGGEHGGASSGGCVRVEAVGDDDDSGFVELELGGRDGSDESQPIVDGWDVGESLASSVSDAVLASMARVCVVGSSGTRSGGVIVVV